MKNTLKQETAALMQLFPFRYPPEKFTSPQKRFVIILNEMFLVGKNAGISRVVSERNLRKTRYVYNVLIDFKYVKSYNTSGGAKNRIFREYLKLKKKQNGKEKEQDIVAY